MTIPAFPSQDLAKLVLGYLAEEQLMTAYDEFLQASPYLDALKNEYDRIFMTSLRNILAEYRAVKIYVETCKPLILRKKLVQCTNLLEMIKVLVSYADVSKLMSQDTITDKISLSKPNTPVATKHNLCEVCMSINLPRCVCKSKQSRQIIHTPSHVGASSLENSVETTALEDLPGSQINRKKHSRVFDKESSSESNLIINENIKQSTITLNTSGNGLNCYNSHSKSNESSSLNIINSMVKTADTPECMEKIEEFNSILNKVCNTSNADKRLFNIPPQSDTSSSRVTTANFEDFALGVRGKEKGIAPVPDSSTSEKSISQILCNDNTRDISNTSSDVSKKSNEHSEIQLCNTYPYTKLKPKSNEQKIKIISDIKVDSPYTTVKSAKTSTPLMHTIVINGTPAYKQKVPSASNNYTKDEIMAMPTFIVVPPPGPPQASKLTQKQPALSQKIKKVKTKKSVSTKVLGPLVIDVSSSSTAINDKNCAVIESGFKLQSIGNEPGLIKTVDSMKNASVPKDSTIPGSTQTNTPQVIPPLRKSSSTPRRNSHIRVLDFTTPRRILHETIEEKVPLEINEKPTVEVVITGSPNIVFTETTNCANNIVDMSNVKVHKIETHQISNFNKNNEVKQTTNKSRNWDDDLRALAMEGKAAPVTKKPRIRNTKKKSDKNVLQEKNKEADETTSGKRVRGKRKSSPKGKKSKRRKLEEEEEQYNSIVHDKEISNVTVKPTFNIVPADACNTQKEVTKPNEIQNKSNNEKIDETPEAERILLQNEIGVKLNISDLLETPYKQALYDIQMETPKFLGSVLPDEPISDIKIMNIPTPRFFDTPKPVQTTPYSSRATDYSSGGSYYKPDEQDYLRIPDLECPVTSSKEANPNKELIQEQECDNKKSSRPVRKCAKNVSYKARTSRSQGLDDDKAEMASTCSDSTSLNSSVDNSNDRNKETAKTPKTPKPNKSKLPPKSETKKKLESGRKRKTPVKKDKPIFMKIKPRRPTPIKDNKRIRRKSVLQSNSPKSQGKKRNSGREKTDSIAPVVTCVPTKSRRKSSTPRKLHCTKQFNSESSADSPEMNVTNAKPTTIKESAVVSQDSDTEQLALRWSDDGSQDAKTRVSECEDISKIKEYIENTVPTKIDYNDAKGTLQVDLIKRGFDAETAKIIERDLLDTPSDFEHNCQSYVHISVPEKHPILSGDSCETESKNVESVVKVPTVQNAEEEDDIELSVSECNEESHNYIICESEAKEPPKGDAVTLKDSWCMEICIDDGQPIRLRATTFQSLFDSDPQVETVNYSFTETEVAVSSITNIDNLYTPLKDRRAQCYEIFDSTLTSLDTPLKLNSPKEKIVETTEIEIVVEEEQLESKDKTDTKKRKRLQINSSTEEYLIDNKKVKPEAQYLFNSTNIQNIDIESVLKKLHGP